MSVEEVDGKGVIGAEELGRVFDDGLEDVDQYFGTENVRYPGREARTAAVDLPIEVFNAVERESAEAGASPPKLIEAWIEERIGAGR